MLTLNSTLKKILCLPKILFDSSHLRILYYNKNCTQFYNYILKVTGENTAEIYFLSSYISTYITSSVLLLAHT